MKALVSIIIMLSCFDIAFAVTSITRHNISWTFADEETCGTYANGDPWCIGPVTVIAISPSSTNISGRIQHGSELNPVVSSSGAQGFDSAFGGSVNPPYDAALNVARPGGSDLSAGNPLAVSAGNSLVSTRTNDTANVRPQIVDASVLTIVFSQPAANSFRPPYSGTNKTSTKTVSDIQWSLLPRLSTTDVSSIPTLSSIISATEKLWFDSRGGIFNGREFHPSNNMPDYGAYMAKTTGEGFLLLMLDSLTEAQKEPLMINLLQFGIDTHGVTAGLPSAVWLKNYSMGGFWWGGGGHGHGRKLPIYFASLILNDSSLLQYMDGEEYPIFQEEQQHFYVSQTDVDLARYTADGSPRDPYTTEMIGTPEWGEQHLNQPNRDGSNIGAYYRNIVSPSITGHVFAALAMGMKNGWNWDALFDYQDRYQTITTFDGGIYDSEFFRTMWSVHRDKFMERSASLNGPGSAALNGAGSLTIQ